MKICKNQKGSFEILFAIQLLIIIFVASGWFINLVKLSKLDFKAPYKAETLRGIGLIPPMGAVIGWMHIEDGDQSPE